MKKNMVYFVMYIVLLSELLAVITERDNLQEEENQIRDKMITTIATMYKKPISITIPDKFSSYKIDPKNPPKVSFIPIGLYSKKEKQDVKFVITVPKGTRTPPNWPVSGITNSTHNKNYFLSLNNGNAVFSAKIVRPGTYRFNVYCEVNRVLPDYLPDRLLKVLKKEIGKQSLMQKSKVEDFQIQARQGISATSGQGPF